MASIPVRFIYVTGIKRRLFNKAVLVGSWDSEGRYTRPWRAAIDMQPITWEDGCLAYVATVNFDATQVNWQFQWGVQLIGTASGDSWGIPCEIRDYSSAERFREFKLRPPVPQEIQEELFYLTHARRLGAQKLYHPGRDPALRLAVWAPNARNVEVVIGATWDVDDPSQQPLGRHSLNVEKIAGGYIDDAVEQAGLICFPMHRQDDGVWTTPSDLPALQRFHDWDHQPYMFRVTRDDGSIRYRTDLYSRCQIGSGRYNPEGRPYRGRIRDLDGSVSCSVIVDPDRITGQFEEQNALGEVIWPETHWNSEEEFWRDEYNPNRPVPRNIQDLVIYELHVGALGFGHPGPGTLANAITLLDYLELLGVNAVELLPMAEFGGGTENWGYATSHYFAIEYGGGGRDKYKFFIRECHRRGIAVIIDVVYNHYVHAAERAQWMYDSAAHERNIHYWYEGLSTDYPGFDASVPPERRGTGGYLDNLSTAWAPRYHEEMVRKTFISMAVVLIEEFHVDGFRVDQTTSIHAYNTLHADGRLVPHANIFGAKFLREWTRTMKLIQPDIILMAEDHSGWDKVTAHPDQGGLGFDATWYADFYHHLIGDTNHDGTARLLKEASYGDDRPLDMGLFAKALEATAHATIVYHESHDEAGNGTGTQRTIVTAVNGAPLVGETRKYAEARSRVVAGITLLSGGTPMFLFGEEVGVQKPFRYGEVLEAKENLAGQRNGEGARLFRFYQDLIRLRLGHAGLRSRSINVRFTSDEDQLLAFERSSPAEKYFVVVSLANRPYLSGYCLRGMALSDGSWREVFNSDSAQYGGDDVGNLGGIVESRGGTFTAVLPANGFVVFKKV
jgi:1,4-alpha-glucan branching enzyme